MRSVCTARTAAWGHPSPPPPRPAWAKPEYTAGETAGAPVTAAPPRSQSPPRYLHHCIPKIAQPGTVMADDARAGRLLSRELLVAAVLDYFFRRHVPSETAHR